MTKETEQMRDILTFVGARGMVDFTGRCYFRLAVHSAGLLRSTGIRSADALRACVFRGIWNQRQGKAREQRKRMWLKVWK